MRWRGPLISMVLHGALGALVLLLVTGAGARSIEQYMTFAETASIPPPPPVSPRPDVRREGPALERGTAPARRAVRAGVASEAQSPASAADLPEVHDFGLVLDGAGEGPAVGVQAAPPSSSGSAPRAAASAASSSRAAATAPCREALQQPKPLTRTTLADAARARTGARGRLVLKVHVTADGGVRAVDVAESVTPAIDREVSAAVRSWRFTPAQRCGQPVPGTYTLAIRFED
jgi:periplasmic protein TonB